MVHLVLNGVFCSVAAVVVVHNSMKLGFWQCNFLCATAHTLN
jgi:hypothetical protein